MRKELCAILGVILLISVFYNVTTTKKLKAEISDLKEQIEQLRAENDMLALENAELKQKLAQIELKGKEVLGGFTFTGDTLCSSNGRPIVYFFGTSWCPHCRWEKPILLNVTAEFGNLIEVRFYEIDKETPPQEEMEVFKKYNPRGTIPTIIIGCRYFRAGSGESLGEDKERETLEILLCRIAPQVKVCSKYKEKLKELP